MLTNKQLTGNEFVLKDDEVPVTNKDVKVENADNLSIEVEKVKKQSQIESEKY